MKPGEFLKEDEALIAGNFLSEGKGQEKMVIYQILVRLFGNKKTFNIPYGTLEENGTGKFNDISEEALFSLKELGVTHIWYTGIIEHAVLTGYPEYGIFSDHPSVVKGRAGSPYAIRDYYDVNPDLAVNIDRRMAEFEALVKRTHDQGLKVIIDFVPNHVARAYYSDAKPEGVRDFGSGDDPTASFSPSNNFYYLPGKPFHVPESHKPDCWMHDLPENVKTPFVEFPAKASGNDVFNAEPGINDWFETIKLNFGVDFFDGGKEYFDPVPDTWIKMRDILIFWAGKHVDGFRCDVAGMVPVQFWAWVIPQVKAVSKHIIFIAEIYKPEQFDRYLKQGNFDFMYDKINMYNSLKEIIQKKATVTKITEVWKSLKGINHNMLRFLENHDEQRLASPQFAGDPFRALPALALICFMADNPVLVYFGQEVGESGEEMAGYSGNDGRTSIFDYWGVPSHQKWMNEGKFDGGKLDIKEKLLRNCYTKILNLCKDHPVMREGDFFDLHAYNRQVDPERQGNHDRVYYFLRFTGEKKLLIIVNFDDILTQEIKIRFPMIIGGVELFPPGNETMGMDLLHPEVKYVFRTDTIPVSLNITPAPLGMYVIEF